MINVSNAYGNEGYLVGILSSFVLYDVMNKKNGNLEFKKWIENRGFFYEGFG